MKSNGKNENSWKNEDLVTTKSFDNGQLVAIIYFFMLYLMGILLFINYICNILNVYYTSSGEVESHELCLGHHNSSNFRNFCKRFVAT